MNEPGRSPQDEALQRAIRQLDVSDGPPAELDQRIRARAHAAVRRRRGLPLWLSAVASVFVVFFAASLWRYQGQAPPPSASDDASLSVEQRKEGADAAEEMTESKSEASPATPAPAQFNESEAASRSEQAAGTGAGAASRLSARTDDDAVAAAPAEISSPAVSREQSVGRSGAQTDSQTAARQRIAPAARPTPPAAFPEPAPAPPAPMAPPAPTVPAEPPALIRPAPLAEAAKRVAPARTESAPMTADRLDALADEQAESDRSVTTSGPAVGAESSRELAREQKVRESEARDARSRQDQDVVGELQASFPAACLADSAAECFDQVRRLREDGRGAEAGQLLRDTMKRFDEPVPEDLRALLE